MVDTIELQTNQIRKTFARLSLDLRFTKRKGGQLPPFLFMDSDEQF
jgi:hypothetical protein